MEGFSAVVGPLYQLTRKTSKGFQWTPQCQQAFDTLKRMLVSPPILAYPQFDVPFAVHTDASAHAIGGVLSQIQDGKERVIAYWSRQLRRSEKNYSTIEREALAVVDAIKEFYPYLYGFSFTLYTDHNPLVSLKTVKDFGGRVSRWLLLLQQFDFTVVYKPGTSNGNADCLSRRPPPVDSPGESGSADTDPEIDTVAVVHDNGPPNNLIWQEQAKDAVLTAVKAALLQGSPMPTQFRNQQDNLVIEKDCLYRRGAVSPVGTPCLQVVVPSSLRNTILEHLHDKGGHLGVCKTTEKLAERYFWPAYTADVEKWVKECQACQRRNSPPQKVRAPLGTIQAEYPLQKLSWDIMGPLPASSKGYKYILVVTDLFTKWVEAFPLHSTESTTLATVLVDEIACWYGVPRSIHSDQGANLTSAVIQHLCLLLGMQRTQTSAYHPQGNGQVERFNRTLEAMLAMVVQANQRDWDVHLPKVLFAYRTAVHESTQFTPYHLVFGRSPMLPVDVMLQRPYPPQPGEEGGQVNVPQFVEDTHHYFKEAYNAANKHLKLSNSRRKQGYDKKEHGESFSIGDCVLLYTPAIKPGRSKKFAGCWRGPYTVVDKTSPVNYRIQLIGTQHQLVIHQNRMKLFYGDHSHPKGPRESKKATLPTPAPTRESTPVPPSNTRPSYADIVKGPSTGTEPTSSEEDPMRPSRPQRNRYPPQRYGNPVFH